VHRATPLAREAALSAGAAASLAAALAWLGPPGSDLAAHAYQRALFLEDGFALWNNFWYAGRYSFITYSVLYYPLAALLGIKLLAVATIATAAMAFAVVLRREWGPAARWSSRTFAVVWAGVVLSAAFPFALGAAFALLALWALQARARGRFALLAALTLAASPVAFLLLALVLAGVGIARWREHRRLLTPALTVLVAGAIEVVLWRAFPDDGQFPFPIDGLVLAVAFSLLGIALTWRVEGALLLRWTFLLYLCACLAAYLIPSEVGGNIMRLRYAAVPVAVLAVSLRRWRPVPLCLATLALAGYWNVGPIVADYLRTSSDPAAQASYWQPAIRFLRAHLTPSYRVEVVDTTGHWAAMYLPRAGIPLVRGWFRQDDFPANKVLYDGLGATAYLDWLRGLGVRYVVLTDAPPDYSSRAEAQLVRSGAARLRPVLEVPHLTVYEVPSPRPLVTGPGPAEVMTMTRRRVVVRLSREGRYRLAVRHSPYWRPSSGCIEGGADGMIRLTTMRAGRLELRFDVDAGRALATVAGGGARSCAD
jgi:hypothetical protein